MNSATCNHGYIYTPLIPTCTYHWLHLYNTGAIHYCTLNIHVLHILYKKVISWQSQL